MDEKSKVMSLSIKPSMQEMLKESAKRMRCSVSKLVTLLIEKHLSLIINDGMEIPVIIRVPKELRGDEEGLKKWMQSRSDAIVNALRK